MFPGDSVLYYTKLNKESAFRFCGTVSCTIDSPELSAAIWGSPDFRYIHVCEDTPEIILNKEVVFGLLDYKLGRVQGFMKVSGKHLDRLSEFENVENMVEFLQEFESIDHHIDTKIGEEVSEKQLPNPGKRLKSIEKYYRDAQKRLEEGKIICQRKCHRNRRRRRKPETP